MKDIQVKMFITTVPDPKFCSLLNYCHAAITSTRIDPAMFLVAFPSGALAGPTGITCPGSAIEPHLIGYYFTKTKQTPMWTAK